MMEFQDKLALDPQSVPCAAEMTESMRRRSDRAGTESEVLNDNHRRNY
jgi:hypothetical protein